MIRTMHEIQISLKQRNKQKYQEELEETFKSQIQKLQNGAAHNGT